MCGSSSVVHASMCLLTFFLLEATLLSQFGPNLHEAFMGTRSRMSSIMSEIRPVTPELLALKD